MKTLPMQRELRELASPEIAEHSQRFFKTGPGEYGEGDLFLGVRVPQLRKLAKKHRSISVEDAIYVLRSKYHEERLLSLLVLVLKFEKGDDSCRRIIFQHYLDNTEYINNWDLVDSSAHHIVGGYLEKRRRDKLIKLAQSCRLWERRIAIISTYRFIKTLQFDDTLTIAKILLNDKEDLIHKAVGWMLREVGKKDQAVALEFLNKHHNDMPRVMLRYAIERYPKPIREQYLQTKKT